MNVMRKMLSILISELKLIAVPTLQFILGSLSILMLLTTVFDYTFNPQWGVSIFLISWCLSVVAFCGIFWCYRQNKYVIYYRMLSVIAYFSLNHFLLWLLRTYGFGAE